MQRYYRLIISSICTLWLLIGCQPIQPVVPVLGEAQAVAASAPLVPPSTTSASSIPSTTTVITPASPVRLKIPTIGVDAVIEPVGLTDEGIVEAPQRFDQVAWYELGKTPGAQGKAVISGHLDDPQGPAVFWRLGELQPGDEVMIVDAEGIEWVFAVVVVEAYPFDESPLNKIFGYDIRRNLNLITCEGDWNQSTGNYSERLVVYTRLVDESL